MKVLYFAELKEILNQSAEEFNIYKDITVEDFEVFLFQQHSELSSKTFQIALNEEFAKKDDIVQPHDTIALIPPVSGG